MGFPKKSFTALFVLQSSEALLGSASWKAGPGLRKGRADTSLRQRDDVFTCAVGADLAAKERNTTKKQALLAEKDIAAVLTLAAIVNVERIIRFGNEMHTLSLSLHKRKDNF